MKIMATTARTAAPETAVLTGDDLVARPAARRLLAAVRITTGFVFLWAFLDKTFGLGVLDPLGARMDQRRNA
jgi:thiosulfate dehydrogenase (quinone) large subunit